MLIAVLLEVVVLLLPAGQLVHELAPVTLLYVPAPQLTQYPERLEYVP